MNSVVAGVLLGSVAWTAFAQEPAGKGVNFYSPAKEVELGRQLAANLARALPPVHEPKLDAYIAQLAGLLTQPDAQFTCTFTVYDDRKKGAAGPESAGKAAGMPADAFQGPPTEPVALAGGPVFVPLSLLANAPNEAVFAFQLAHAMAHIALRHSTRMATRAELTQISEKVAASSAQPGPTPERHALAVPLSFLTFARAAEREADFVAARTVAQAGYNPAAMIDYLNAQPAQEKNTVFSAHPATRERAAAIRSASESLPLNAYSAATGGFAEARALAASIH